MARTMPEIHLLDWNLEMAREWQEQFAGLENVHVSTDSFEIFMLRHFDDVDCIVSPANSYGLMDGGYDLSIIQFLGEEAQELVQAAILEKHCGEQPVGSSLSIRCEGRVLIHTPTMRVPSTIVDEMVVYQAMRTTLIEALAQGVRSMVIPAFGAGTGAVPYAAVARMMRAAYDQVANPPTTLDWDYAYGRKLPDQVR